MQHEPICTRAAVERISKERRPRRSEVRAELMCAAGERLEKEESGCVGCSEHRAASERATARMTVRSIAGRLTLDCAEREADLPAFFSMLQRHRGEREIELLEPSFLERLIEASSGAPLEGTEEETAGLYVETVREGWSSLTARPVHRERAPPRVRARSVSEEAR